jgi:TetR/AcrR family transcriptional regulator
MKRQGVQSRERVRPRDSRRDSAKDPTKEELILSAAMDVFVERGWNGARMQDIADRAGINKALLHYYFRTKEKLYDRIIETVFSSFFMQVEQAFDDDDSFDRVLRRFIDAVIDIIAADPRLPMFILHELSQGGKNVKAILSSIIGQYRLTLPQRMFALIERELEAGTIRPVDPGQFMITLLGACIYFFIAEPVVQPILMLSQPLASYDRRQLIAGRKESIFDVLYYGLKKRNARPPE